MSSRCSLDTSCLSLRHSEKSATSKIFFFLLDAPPLFLQNNSGPKHPAKKPRLLLNPRPHRPATLQLRMALEQLMLVLMGKCGQWQAATATITIYYRTLAAARIQRRLL